MGEVRYIISDASKKVDIEQHTLRYWEEELELNIQRNEMGHRYYREEDIELLKAVKVLKEKGYQLRAIKMLLPKIQKLNSIEIDALNMEQNKEDEKEQNVINKEETLNYIPTEVDQWNGSEQELTKEQPEKLEQFKDIMTNLIRSALQENNEVMSESISESVATSVIKEMDYLIRMKEEREEERFKQFDRTLRELQNSRAEVAVSKREKKKRRLFKK